MQPEWLVKGNYIYVLGASYGSSYDIVLIQYDLTGTQQWVSRYDAGGEDFPVAMTIDDNGNAYIVGTSTDGGAGKDMIALEVDINGNQTFLGLFDYNNFDDIATGITLSPDQTSVYVTGGSTDALENREFTTIKYYMYEGSITRTYIRENTPNCRKTLKSPRQQQ